MKCKNCDTGNPAANKFCRECGASLFQLCPNCGFKNLPEDKFCGECGEKLEIRVETGGAESSIEGERKQVTVLFSDLSGYTAMTEKLDPEETKEILSRIFGETAQIVSKYEGHIERFIGDAVMVLFGVPKAHEDDPIRAIKVANEIREFVEMISSQLKKRIGRSISMHTGINTGLAVTGEVDFDKGTERVLGDSINVASRLTDLAKEGEVLVGEVTYRQTERYFNFESLGPFKVKGKKEPIKAYKVHSVKEKPITIHRLSGLRAKLVGRKAELFTLKEAIQDLKKNNRVVISIWGGAGTGKSRLIEELKRAIDLKKIQWYEGHAYAYSNNIPYFLLVDLLSRAWNIEESASQKEVKKKIEEHIKRLLGEENNFAPFIGKLYGLDYPETKDIDPEFWKSRLFEVVKKIFSTLTQRRPTILCLEDLHWADPSSIELLRTLISKSRYPAFVLYTYRPPFTLFNSQEKKGLGESFKEIVLKDLSPTEAEEMMGSLLKSKHTPLELRKFIQEKAEGNPFYLEEVMNSLIESEILIRDNGSWKLARSINELSIPITVSGVITARIDRLEIEMKQILQEASVIGRAFPHELIKRITKLREHLDTRLNELERLDLIRTKSFEPELEYMFKHALTQDVVYSGLLKKDRREIHEKIALVMEELFRDRLEEFYETIAFHYKQGKSLHKAIDYLMKSGEKSMKRYSAEESHWYYQEAFDLLVKESDEKREKELLVDLLIKWSPIYYYRGDFREAEKLLQAFVGLAESLGDKTRLGKFYGWLSAILQHREKPRASYEYGLRAVELGEEVKNHEVIGYACTWLAYSCADLGLLDEALMYAERALKISKSLKSDDFLYYETLGIMGYVYLTRGESKKTLKAGEALLEYGKKKSHIRSLVMGHWVMGQSYLADGDFPAAIESNEQAIKISEDPWYPQFPRLFLGLSYATNGQFREAEEAIKDVSDFSQKFGDETLGTPARALQGVILIAKGQMSRGLEMFKSVQKSWLENECRYRYAYSEYILGKLYLEIVEGSSPVSLATIVKNIGFLVKNMPFAKRKAELCFRKAIKAAEEIEAYGLIGPAYLDLGLLYRMSRNEEKARDCLAQAAQYFERCGASTYLKKTKEALAGLG
jgi:class 3 adenylate cyclase/tetratricopeptide (TPR) repeat protein